MSNLMDLGYSQTHLALLMKTMGRGKQFVFIDGKSDNDEGTREIVRSAMKFVQQREIAQLECSRRRVRFLPRQCLRPLFAAAGCQ